MSMTASLARLLRRASVAKPAPKNAHVSLPLRPARVRSTDSVQSRSTHQSVSRTAPRTVRRPDGYYGCTLWDSLRNSSLELFTRPPKLTPHVVQKTTHKASAGTQHENDRVRLSENSTDLPWERVAWLDLPLVIPGTEIVLQGVSQCLDKFLALYIPLLVADEHPLSRVCFSRVNRGQRHEPPPPG